MRKLNLAVVMLVLVLVAIVSVDAARGATLATVSWTGDRSLVTTFRVDDGMTGKPGYRRALWTSHQPLRANLRVRNSAGKLIEAENIAGPIYSLTEALAWTTKATGSYRVTLTLISATGGTATAVWTARVTAAACTPTVRTGVYIGCG